jgi:hypothetical protein
MFDVKPIGQPNIDRRRRDSNLELSLLDYPAAILLIIPILEGVLVQLKYHLLGLTGLERDLVKRFKLLVGSGETRYEVSNIELNALSAKDFSHVLYVKGDSVSQLDCSILSYDEVTVFEAGVGQSMTKGESRLDRSRVKVTVADVDVLDYASYSVGLMTV